MTNPQQPESAIDEEALARHKEALARHKKVLEDFSGLEAHMSKELRANLEATMTPESRDHVLTLCLTAIQYGRNLEQQDMDKKVSVAPEYMQVLVKELLMGTKERKIVIAGNGPSPSALVRQLMNNINRTKH